MARPTHVYTIEYVATLIGENLALLEEIASNSDNIDYGEMIHAYDGTDEGITFANSSPTNSAIRKGSNASWQTSRNHKPRGLRRMDTSVFTTCRLNDVDPKAWLADVFARIRSRPHQSGSMASTC